ncbi:MAG: 3'-5' exonuclease [Verrucomicrobiales bacterium]
MMTPLGEAIRERNLGQASASTAILEDVLADGFERVLAKWMARLRRAWRDRDPFSERRLEELRACARLFDLSGSRRIAEFLEFADAYKSRDAQSPGVVQVTTVHKSKGLGFDIVILPELGGDSLTATRADLAVKEGDRGAIDWIFRMPVKEFAKADPVLRAYTEEEEADACYESLCDFYVAMTRAKRAMYLIAEPLGKSSQRKNFVRLLEHTLAAGQPGGTAQVGALAAKLRYADGDPDWISRRSGQTPRHQPKLPMPAVPAAKPRRRMARRTPSGSESYALTPAQLFSRDGRAARDFGTAVHALFEDVEWAEDAAPAERRAAWEAQGHDARAIAQTIACLDDAALRQELGRPAPGAAVWRERRFEIALGGEWISGTFDRVTLLPGSDPGTFASAQILDFKTDKASADETAAQIAERYRPQQELYRRVLAKLANLPENKIEYCLMFTAQREVVRLF